MVIEVPNLLMPNPKAYAKKLMLRMKGFLGGCRGADADFHRDCRDTEGDGPPRADRWLFRTPCQRLVGPPRDAVVALILGVVRREMAVASALSN